MVTESHIPLLVETEIPLMKRFSHTGWCPSSLAKLVQITIITRVYDTQIAILTWGYKPTNITGGAHPIAIIPVFPF
jgi:hypothetical protein